jgi:cbb3-type cytochrome oxidase subunit 3
MSHDIIFWLLKWSPVGVGVVFSLILITTYWPGRKARFERDAEIPLRDDC